MRILLLNHFPLTGSGSGVYTMNIANSLIKQGHEVCIIMPENEIVKEIKDIKLHPVYFNGITPDALSFNFPCFTTHPRSNMNFYDLSLQELNEYINAFDKAIKEEVETFRPDIIHVGHIWILGHLVSKYKIPYVITTHGTDLLGYMKSSRFNAFAESAIKSANKIITISNENKRLVEYLFPLYKEKCFLLPNGYDTSKFYIKEVDKNKFLKSIGINNNYDKIITYVGKFTEIKGIDILIKAVTLYDSDNTLTVLVGDGKLLKKLKDITKILEAKNVVFLGNQPHDVICDLYNIADVSVVPSRSEAFGLVVIEALACGIPVIGSNIGGIKDIINDDVGLFFNCNDYHDLKDKLKLVLDDKISFDKNLIASYAEDNFSQDKFTDKLIEIYNESIKEGKL